jgi:HK97 family phage portal protein
MAVLKKLFNRSPTQTRIKMVTEHGNGFYSWNGKLYESDIVRSCIRPYSKAVGKLVGKQIRESENNLQINPDVNIKLLLQEPNPYMTMQMFLEKMAIQLKLNNNAFAYIIRNDMGYPIEVYPIVCDCAECVYLGEAELYIKFTMKNGTLMQFPYTDIIHLRQDYNENDIFGESPAKALTKLMDIATTTDQGIVKAIKNGAVIRWLLKFESVLRPEELEKKTKDFAESFMNVEKSTGVAGIDNKMNATQVSPNDYVPNADQTDRTTARIYNFFNTNERIVQSKYNEDEWNAYYESEIEPIAIQLSCEFSRKFFSRRERAFGNKIIFECNNLQYASMQTKLNLLQMVDRGALSPNEWRQVLNLAPIDGGDVIIRRLDTAPTDYQKGGD